MSLYGVDFVDKRSVMRGSGLLAGRACTGKLNLEMAYFVVHYLAQEIGIFHGYMLQLAASFALEMHMAFPAVGINSLVVALERMNFAVVFQRIEEAVDCRAAYPPVFPGNLRMEPVSVEERREFFDLVIQQFLLFRHPHYHRKHLLYLRLLLRMTINKLL